MKRLLSLALLIVLASCGSSTADATSYMGLYATTGTSLISPSVTMNGASSTLSGTGPFYVFFDASATTDGDSTACPSCDPFRDLRYTWSFGDASAPNWTTGIRTGAGSGNAAYGPVAAHVFTAAGTYNVTLTVTDGTNTVSNYAAGTVTVVDPNTTFATTATTCYSGSGTFTNCPSGATQTTSSTWLTGTISAGHRYLFHCGETFTAAAGATLTTTSTGYIGAYDCGVAAAPVIQATANGFAFLSMPSASGSAGDWRITGLDFEYNTHTGLQFTGGSGAVNVNNILVYNNTFNHVSQIFPTDFSVGHAAQYIGIVGNTINTASGDGVYGYYYGIGVVGNHFDGTGTSGTFVNIIRLMGPQRYALSNNTFTHFGNSQGVWITTRCHDVVGSQQAGYGVISENIAAPSGTGGFGVGTASTVGGDPTCTNTENIVENNFLYLDGNGGGHPTSLAFDATYSDVRNNVVNSTGISGNTNAIQSYKDGSGSASDHMRFYNNTVYDGTGTATQFILLVSTTNTILKNNMLYAPSGTSAQMIATSGSPTGTTESNNTCGTGAVTSCAGTIQTSPNFANGSATFLVDTDFKPVAASYAIGAGTSVPVWADLVQAAEPSPRDLGGINH